MSATTAAERAASVRALPISDKEFQLFQRFMFDRAGVTLSSAKKALVVGRLSKRLKACNCASFRAYYELLERSSDESATAVDLLTTNETYFFRESRHFDYLRSTVLSLHDRQNEFRAWSAACSSGEEVYSLAMVLADALGSRAWTVVGSDINTQVLQKARKGHYSMARTEGIPPDYLKRFCLKGTGSQAGTFLVGKQLRERAEFQQVNLNSSLPRLGQFDVIFLRNVMIYFSHETKHAVARRVIGQLKPGGFLFVGHSESLTGAIPGLELVRPSVYRKQS